MSQYVQFDPLYNPGWSNFSVEIIDFSKSEAVMPMYTSKLLGSLALVYGNTRIVFTMSTEFLKENVCRSLVQDKHCEHNCSVLYKADNYSLPVVLTLIAFSDVKKTE